MTNNSDDITKEFVNTLKTYLAFGKCYRENFRSNSVLYNHEEAVKFFSRTTEACQKYRIPPALLLMIIIGFVNFNPRDPQAQFSFKIFRSETFISRALMNYRNYIREKLLVHKEYVTFLIGKDWAEVEAETNLYSLSRILVHINREYYRRAVPIMFVMRRKRAPDVLELDLEHWNQANQNAFLVAGLFKTPKIADLAFSNLYIQARKEPWNTYLWEGISADGVTLSNVYVPNQNQERWPYDPLSNDPNSYEEGILGPQLKLSISFYSPQLETFLKKQCKEA